VTAVEAVAAEDISVAVAAQVILDLLVGVAVLDITIQVIHY
jgi:hypothetical protein